MEGLGRLLRADLRLKERKYELPGEGKGIMDWTDYWRLPISNTGYMANVAGVISKCQGPMGSQIGKTSWGHAGEGLVLTLYLFSVAM